VQPPTAVSSRAGQEGGCGEEGKQDLKTANMHGAIVDIPPGQGYGCHRYLQAS
jgi:hypothetical protein